MNTLEASLRPAAPEDAVTIAALATQVFLDTYASEGVRPDLAQEAFAEYSAEAFARRLDEPHRRFILAEQASALTGFAEIRVGSFRAPDGIIVGAELVRLYVQPRFQRLGLGKRLLLQAEKLVLAASQRELWLTMWEGNARAHRFYTALGYRDAGATSYAFQDRSYVNRVLAKHLDPGP